MEKKIYAKQSKSRCFKVKPNDYCFYKTTTATVNPTDKKTCKSQVGTMKKKVKKLYSKEFYRAEESIAGTSHTETQTTTATRYRLVSSRLVVVQVYGHETMMMMMMLMMRTQQVFAFNFKVKMK